MTKRLLIADDDAMLLQLLRLDFEQRNSQVEIVTAEDGDQAIASIEASNPHILVLDLRMPKSDGFKVLEHIKASKYDFPVIVLTNYNKPEYREKCTHYGVHEYIVKSETRFSQIMGKLEEYVRA
jgi:DNA-binding NarL/FixJ family response regulator